jgi:mannose-6-phosphate isomerase-like protein (cupin superfamily)
MDKIKVFHNFTNKIENMYLKTDDNFELFSMSSIDEQSLTVEVGSVFLYIHAGTVSFDSDGATHRLSGKHFFSRKGPLNLLFSKGSFVIIIKTPPTSNVLNIIGGPIEDVGRLKYIDGCSDTLLISPVKLGEPCLNFLHFPLNTNQTMHHHPSFRFGIVARGSGESVSEVETVQLTEGDIFFIPKFYNHKFNTYDNIMDIIAFHPDSDWGPTDEVHPMINRTWVNGKSIK